MKLNIALRGNRLSDITAALRDTLRQIEAGNRTGSQGDASRGYYFDLTGVESIPKVAAPQPVYRKPAPTFSPQDLLTIAARREITRQFRLSPLNAGDFAPTVGVSRSTLYRILAEEKQGDAALADGRRHNKGTSLQIDPALCTWLFDFHLDHPCLRVTTLHRAMAAKAREMGCRVVPSYDWVKRFLAKAANQIPA